MTWLYVPPSTPLDCAPASEVSNSASASASIFADTMCAGSVTWRGKPLERRAWLRRWTRGGFILRLSGATLPPSTADRGVAAFISSLPVIPAKATASLASASARTIPVSSSATSYESWTKCGLIVSSAKTSRGTRTDSSTPSRRHWKQWVTALRQEYSARPEPVTRMVASGLSSWPTARVERGGYTRDHGNPSKERLTLEGLAQAWMTPNVPNGGRTANHATQRGKTMFREDGSKVQFGLEHQTANWATPQARDHFPAHSNAYVAAKKAQGHGMRNLNDEAANWPFGYCLPPSFPVPTILHGETSSIAGHNSPQPSPKRKLNPYFVEALMRWPSGLSGFERAETAWTRWWELMPSFVLALCSQTTDDRQGTLL